LRYSSYALGIIACVAAGYQYGTLKLYASLAVVSVIILAQNRIRKQQEIESIDDESAEAKALKISLTVSPIFILSILWGIMIISTHLRLVPDDAKRILKGASQWDPIAVLDRFNDLIFRLAYVIPLAYYMIQKGDEFVFWADTFKSRLRQFLNDYPEQLDKKLPNICIDYILQNFALIIEKVLFGNEETKNYELRREGFAALSKPHKTPLTDFIKTNLFFSCLTDVLWKTKIVINPSSPFLIKVKATANLIFNHSFNFFLLTTRIYFHTWLVATAFFCGLICPTQLRFKKQIKTAWQHPPFFDLPLSLKCGYLISRTLKICISLYLGPPIAILNGLYLAEEFRYYVLPRLKHWVVLPIAPLYYEDNRWQDFLKEDFQKIRPQTDPEDPPEYQEIHGKILEGASSRKLLGLAKGHSDDEIPIGYRKCALIVHPDKRNSEKKQDEATILFKCVKLAKDQLMPVKRTDQRLLERDSEPVMKTSATAVAPRTSAEASSASQLD